MVGHCLLGSPRSEVPSTAAGRREAGETRETGDEIDSQCAAAPREWPRHHMGLDSRPRTQECVLPVGAGIGGDVQGRVRRAQKTAAHRQK